MLKRLGPIFTLALIAAMTLTLSANAATASRSLSMTRGLDYLHSEQLGTGGFNDSSTTAWALFAISAGGERPSLWRVGGKDPIDGYLQNLSLETMATGSTNEPEFYARMILAYVAADEKDKIDHAGSPRIDLVSKLLIYEDIADHHFSPQLTEPRSEASIRTTAWAILALKAAGETGTRLDGAVAWLKGDLPGQGGPEPTVPDGSGRGFASEPGRSPNPDDTALAIMALRAGGGYGTGDTTVGNARDYLQSVQRSNGGFPSRSSDDHSYAESTAAVICALNSVGVDPTTWEKTRGSTPYTYLRGLQRGSGSFSHTNDDPTGYPENATTTASQAVLALSDKWLPLKPVTGHRARAFKPLFTSFTPASGSKFTSSSVAIKATYRDPVTGTGISAGAITIQIDGVYHTRSAHISSTSLQYTATGLTSGAHTVAIDIADKAGNNAYSTPATHTFTVTLPTPPVSPPPTTPPATTPPATHPPTPPPTTPATLPPTPSSTLTPVATYSPVASPSPSPSYFSSSPSPSASGVAVVGIGNGNGPTDASGSDWATIALLSLIPIGGVVAYFIYQRRMNLLSDAGYGSPAGAMGGTSWSRFKMSMIAATSWLHLPRR